MSIKDSDKIISKGFNGKLDGFDFENHHEWTGDFSFIQMADTQFGLTEDFKTGKDDNWDIEISYSKLCIEFINQMKPLPQFVIVCGDMINSFPGGINRRDQINSFLKVFRELHPSIPLICVCGNHDVGNKPTTETLAEYRSDFGDDYFSFWVKGVKFIVINSQYFHDDSMCKDESRKQYDWLMGQLCSDENKTAQHLIMFQHIPWFINDIDEEDEYFNLKTTIRRDMIERFSRAGVSKIFAGHTHRNAGGWFTSESGRKLELVITSAVGYQLGNDEHGFRIVTIKDSSVHHEYRGFILTEGSK